MHLNLNRDTFVVSHNKKCSNGWVWGCLVAVNSFLPDPPQHIPPTKEQEDRKTHASSLFPSLTPFLSVPSLGKRFFSLSVQPAPRLRTSQALGPGTRTQALGQPATVSCSCLRPWLWGGCRGRGGRGVEVTSWRGRPTVLATRSSGGTGPTWSQDSLSSVHGGCRVSQATSAWSSEARRQLGAS